jgi:LysR family transcriptional regulator, transcriptional activator of nhaA
MDFLNYHHLRYFHVIATEGGITRAAERLRISAPALSIQLKQLEESLGSSLLDRSRRGLKLTEAGRVVLDYAETIVKAGDELLDVMKHRPPIGRQILRLGAVATLSRNFQLDFLRPLLGREDVEVIIRSGGLGDMLGLLRSHQVDLILSNQSVRHDAGTPWHSHLLERQPVVVVGAPVWKQRRLRFPRDFNEVPMVLPSLESQVRVEFDRRLAAGGVRPRLLAEVDDMAMLRLMAREEGGLALVPRVVVQGELQRGELVITHKISGLEETFHAIIPLRRYPHPLINKLMKRFPGSNTGHGD